MSTIVTVTVPIHWGHSPNSMYFRADTSEPLDKDVSIKDALCMVCRACNPRYAKCELQDPCFDNFLKDLVARHDMRSYLSNDMAKQRPWRTTLSYVQQMLINNRVCSLYCPAPVSSQISNSICQHATLALINIGEAFTPIVPRMEKTSDTDDKDEKVEDIEESPDEVPMPKRRKRVRHSLALISDGDDE